MIDSTEWKNCLAKYRKVRNSLFLRRGRALRDNPPIRKKREWMGHPLPKVSRSQNYHLSVGYLFI